MASGLHPDEAAALARLERNLAACGPVGTWWQFGGAHSGLRRETAETLFAGLALHAAALPDFTRATAGGVRPGDFERAVKRYLGWGRAEEDEEPDAARAAAPAKKRVGQLRRTTMSNEAQPARGSLLRPGKSISAQVWELLDREGFGLDQEMSGERKRELARGFDCSFSSINNSVIQWRAHKRKAQNGTVLTLERPRNDPETTPEPPPVLPPKLQGVLAPCGHLKSARIRNEAGGWYCLGCAKGWPLVTVPASEARAAQQPCGHPPAAVVGSDEGTHYCGDCAAEAAQNAPGAPRIDSEPDPGTFGQPAAEKAPVPAVAASGASEPRDHDQDTGVAALLADVARLQSDLEFTAGKLASTETAAEIAQCELDRVRDALTLAGIAEVEDGAVLVASYRVHRLRRLLDEQPSRAELAALTQERDTALRARAAIETGACGHVWRVEQFLACPVCAAGDELQETRQERDAARANRDSLQNNLERVNRMLGLAGIPETAKDGATLTTHDRVKRLAERLTHADLDRTELRAELAQLRNAPAAPPVATVRFTAERRLRTLDGHAAAVKLARAIRAYGVRLEKLADLAEQDAAVAEGVRLAREAG